MRPEAENPRAEVSVKEAAKICGTEITNIYQAVRRGRVKSRPVLTQGARGEIRIDLESLNEWRKTIRPKETPEPRPNERPGRTVSHAAHLTPIIAQ